MHPYHTHQRVLAEYASICDGPILELGCGWGSTPMLSGICSARGLDLISVESDKDWFDKISINFDHRFRLTRSWIDIPEYRQKWGLVFVDHGCVAERNASIVSVEAEYIVVHDTEDPIYKYEDVLGNFKYRKDYKSMSPWTTVISNHSPLS
jgi:hypothetical protein